MGINSCSSVAPLALLKLAYTETRGRCETVFG